MSWSAWLAILVATQAIHLARAKAVFAHFMVWSCCGIQSGRSRILVRVPSYSSPQRPELKFDRIETQPFSAVDQLHQLQHFTIDDQILPERTGQATALDYCSLSCSPVTTLVASLVPSNSHFLPYMESLSWLSHPHHLDYLNSPISGRPHAASPWEFIANQSLYTNSSTDLFQNVPTIGSFPESVTLFGQLINARNGDMVEKRK